MSRRINSPGIEINEIDRSSYDRYTDGSSVGTLAMVLGFSDKGQEEEVTWINNMNTFSVMYGTPTTEAERYFYNAAKEIIDQGGLVVGARLPYDNNSKDMYSYVDWSVSEELTETNEMTSDVVSNVLFNSNITSFIEISSTVGFGSIHRDELDNLLVNRRKLGLNRIRVVDKKRTRYEVFDS